jgi:tetratricopeptide (TPR) repeat protein
VLKSSVDEKNNCVQKALRSIIQNQDILVLDDPKKIRALLSDLCPRNHRKKIVLLERLLDEKIHTELVQQKDCMSYEQMSENLTNRILANYPFDKSLVQEGIFDLAFALQIIPDGSRIIIPNQPPFNEYFTRVDPRLAEAINLNQIKSFNDALRVLEPILNQDPGNSIALREKAYAISNLGRYRESLQWYNDALRIDPSDPVAWIQKGYALSKMDKNRDAIYCYDAAIKLDPDGAVVWRNRGFSLRKLKDYPAALESYENALRINPQDPIAWKLKGGALGLMKRYHEAFQATEEALTLDPDYKEAMMNMGWLLSEQGRYEEAKTWYEKVLQIDRNNPRAWKQHGYCLKKINDQENQKKSGSRFRHTIPKKAPTPENQGFMDKIKGFFK